MNIKTYPYLTIDQKSSVQKLWNEQYPKQLNFKSIAELDLYLSGLEDVIHYLILNNDEEILGWAFKFSRDLQRWFVIILSGTIHGNGWGSKMLQKIVENEVEMHGWVVDKNGYTKSDGSMYRSPLDFYHKNGFISIPQDRLETQDFSAVKIIYTKPRENT
ncbi:MAG: N-acetyltransferase [Pedobacter sp.]